MAKRNLQDAYNALRRELNETVGKRDLLNMKIMEIEKSMKGLHPLLFKEKLISLRETQQKTLASGITEAIRTVMRTEHKPMTPADVKARLTTAGFDLGRFRNSSAVIHNTMARMALADELKVDPKTKRYRFPGGRRIAGVNA
jgi:hypothetical protein